MNRKTWGIIIASVLAGGLIVVLTIFVLTKTSQPATSGQLEQPAATSFHDTITGLKLDYAPVFSADNLSGADKSDKFVLRLTSQSPAMLVTVRYEDGIRPVADLTHKSVAETVAGNATGTLDRRYPGAELLEEKKLTVDGHDAIQLIFTYKGPSGELAKQRLLLIGVDDDRAVYIAAQTQAARYDAANKSYLDDLFSSVTFD